MKRPKDISKYVSPEQAAQDLEQIAANLRARRVTHVKCSVQLRFWSEDWSTAKPSSPILSGIEYYPGEQQ